MNVFAAIQRAVRPYTAAPSSDPASSVERAVGWVKAHRVRGGGIPVHHKTTNCTQEVTGYLIATLMDVGEEALAVDLAKWEASVQQADGSFAAPDGIPYTFDTAQVIRGFLAVLEQSPDLEPNLRRACDYVENQIDASGQVQTASLDMWKLRGSGTFSEYVNLFVLPPLLYAGRTLQEPRYLRAVERSLDYYRQKPDLTEFKPGLHTLSHIFGYMMDALAELGESELARKGLAQAAAIQRENGAIPAYPGVEWVCAPGMAQFALAWLRIGDREPAEKALRYLQTIQNPSGGFYGGYGPGAEYFPAEEISWAPKFFIDAMLLADKQRGLHNFR